MAGLVLVSFISADESAGHSKLPIATQSSKRRKRCPPTGVEIINISDEERDNPIALDHSIVATRIRRRKPKTEHVAKLQPTEVVSTPKSLHQPTTPKSASKRRTFFEAVELQKLGAEKLQRRMCLFPRLISDKLTVLQMEC